MDPPPLNLGLWDDSPPTREEPLVPRLVEAAIDQPGLSLDLFLCVSVGRLPDALVAFLDIDRRSQIPAPPFDRNKLPTERMLYRHLRTVIVPPDCSIRLCPLIPSSARLDRRKALWLPRSPRRCTNSASSRTLIRYSSGFIVSAPKDQCCLGFQPAKNATAKCFCVLCPVSSPTDAAAWWRGRPSSHEVAAIC
jgi:hypothetical protein